MNIKLSSILLFSLSIPFIMTYRLSPQDTPFWLFGIIFALLLSYIVLDIINLPKKKYNRLKAVVLWLTIASTLGAGFVSAIIVRHQVAPVFQIHDIILQQEAAIRFLLDGVNPYATTYFGTHMESWHFSDTETNPALYHFVMQPFYLLFAIPFYGVAVNTIGYFDGRIPLFFLFTILLAVSFILPKENEKKLQFTTLLAFNPAMLSYLREGRSDIFMYTFLFVGLFLLYKKKHTLSGFFVALAFAIKQSAWPLFPFYAAYLYYKNKNLKKTALQLLPFTITFLLIVLPFFAWNQNAFLESTVYYLSGNVEHAYPISGYGFGMILNSLGYISDKYQYYPFVIWQAVFALPVAILLIAKLRKNPTINNVIVYYAIFLMIFWYFSRYFNNSHVAYLSMILITAYYWPASRSNEKKLPKK